MQEDEGADSAFAKAFNAVKSSSDVGSAIAAVREIYRVDHVTYHLAQTIAGDYDQPFVRTTYPDKWVSRYLLKGYVNIDPVVREGFKRMLPFDWRELELTDAAVMLMLDAQAHGLAGNGYSIPIIDQAARRALLSINASFEEEEWSDFISENAEHLAELANRMHKLALMELYGEKDPVPRLGRRERECLLWAAQGKEYTVIADILDLSEHTVRSYLKSARLKLDCSNIPQAVAKAMKLRIINIPDTLI